MNDTRARKPPLQQSGPTGDNVFNTFRTLTGREPTDAEMYEAAMVVQSDPPKQPSVVANARFGAMNVAALRHATATQADLAGPPPTLQAMNVDVSGCSAAEIEDIERMVRQIWERE